MEKTSLQNQVWSSVHLAPTWPAEQRYNTGLNTFKTFSCRLTFKNMRSFKNTFLCRKRMFSRTSLTPRRLDWENNKILHQNKTRTYKSCVNNRHSYNNICEHEYISDSDTWLLRPSTLQLLTWGQKCPQIPQKWPKGFTKVTFVLLPKGSWGQFTPQFPHLEHPEKAMFFKKRARKWMNNWARSTFSRSGWKPYKMWSFCHQQCWAEEGTAGQAKCTRYSVFKIATRTLLEKLHYSAE